MTTDTSLPVDLVPPRHRAATGYTVGLAWFVRQVHDPLFADVG